MTREKIQSKGRDKEDSFEAEPLGGQVRLLSDQELSKYKIEDLIKETRGPADLVTVPKAIEQATKEAQEEAKRILGELQMEDIDQLSRDTQQMALKTEIEDLEKEIEEKYTGPWANIKMFFSVSFVREMREAKADLDFAKNAIKILAIQNKNPFVLPNGIEIPTITLVERIKKEVDILRKSREEIEKRVEGEFNFFGTRKEGGYNWMAVRDEHCAILNKYLGFPSYDEKNKKTTKKLDLEDYFKFLDIELKIVQKGLAGLYDLMEACVAGNYIDPDFSQMSKEAISQLVYREKELDLDVVFGTRLTTTGTFVNKATQREFDFDYALFNEARKEFFTKKVEDFIESHEKQVNELADASIFLEIQTHLAEIDKGNPKFDFSFQDKAGLLVSLRDRIVYSALKDFGIMRPAYHDNIRSEKIDLAVNKIVENKINNLAFQDKVTEIVERCYGKKWENGQTIRSDVSMSLGSIKICPDGLMQSHSLTTRPNDDPYFSELEYFVNNEVKRIKGPRNLEDWWPHPLGILFIDKQNNLLLNGEILISKTPFYFNSTYLPHGSPQGITWVDEKEDVYLNGKKIGKIDQGLGEVEVNKRNKFVGLSKNGSVVWCEIIKTPITEDDKKEAGVYINNEQVYCDYLFDRVEPVFSKDFNFVVSKTSHTDFGTRARIFLDGKYEVKAGGDIVNWWVHPRGIVVLDQKSNITFYSFEKIKEDIETQDRKRYEKDEEEKMREIRYRIVDRYTKWGDKIPAKAELDNLARDIIKQEEVEAQNRKRNEEEGGARGDDLKAKISIS